MEILRSWRQLAAVCVVAATAAMVAAAPIHAASLTVTTLDDELNSDGDCSLREAIEAANTDAALSGCAAGSGADIISLPAGTYTLTIAGAGEDANATGDLDITADLTINGAGAATTTVDAAGLDRIFHLVGGPAAIHDVTIAGGLVNTGATISGDDGGGVLVGDGQTMTLSRVTVDGNSAGTNGGGVYVGNAATLTVDGGTITNNVVSGGFYPGGGGIGSGNTNQSYGGTVIVHQSVISGNTGTYGGGFHNGEGASLTITDSTIRGNTMTSSGGGMWSGGNISLERVTVSGNMGVFLGGYTAGAGIYDQSSSGDLVSIVNLTLSGNFAASGIAQGQNLYKTSSEPFDFDSSTITNGDIQANAGEVSFRNTIIDATCTSVISPIFTSNGHNMESGSSCGLVDGVNGDQTNIDPMLALLADNGGPTETHALLPGSPAIDAGSAACPPPATDQRGVTRPQGADCDIGAFELVQTVQVGIDIKPGGFPNSINTAKKGIIPVAVLGSATFDASTVDPSMVCFGDIPDNQGDCTVAPGTKLKDVNGDGILDLVLHFNTLETGIDPGDTQACLTGKLLDGTSIEGCDSVKAK